MCSFIEIFMIYPVSNEKFYTNTKTPCPYIFQGDSKPVVVTATQPTLAPQISRDTVEFSAEKTIKKEKGLSKWQKWTIGLGSALAGIIAAGVLISKHETGKLTKLYNEKMQLVNLAEKIDFKEAKTVDEGIKFAKDVLKIGEVGDGFTLDAINYANKGLVDVANANKGHLFMPKKLIFEELKENEIAHVIRNIDSNSFGELAINKRFFDTKVLDEKLKKILFYSDGKQKFKLNNKDGKIEIPILLNVGMVPDKKCESLIKQFYENSAGMNIADKRKLVHTISAHNEALNGQFERFPLDTLKKNRDFYEKKLGIKIDIESLSKKSTEEQTDYLCDLAAEVREKGFLTKYDMKLQNPEETIYHEMGHLQDYAKNLKELDIKKWKIPSFKDAWKDAKADKKHQSNTKIDHVNNRWRGLAYDGFKDLFDKDPEKFKKKYPDLYEFLTNQTTQQTAGKVSQYAQRGIGEFVAEVYAKLVSGAKLPDDVMALYKKYNGPMLAA